VNEAANCSISDAAKYLGIMIGPGGTRKSWDAPTKKYVSRVQMIRSAANGLCQSLVDYNTYAIPVLMHVAKFEHPPLKTLQAENKALQTLTAGPWNAIPADLMMQLKDIGYTAEAPSIYNISRTLMYQMVERYPVFDRCVSMIDEARDEDDRVFRTKTESMAQTGAHLFDEEEFVRNERNHNAQAHTDECPVQCKH